MAPALPPRQAGVALRKRLSLRPGPGLHVTRTQCPGSRGVKRPAWREELPLAPPWSPPPPPVPGLWCARSCSFGGEGGLSGRVTAEPCLLAPRRGAGGPDWAGPGQLTGQRRASGKQLLVQVSFPPGRTERVPGGSFCASGTRVPAARGRLRWEPRVGALRPAGRRSSASLALRSSRSQSAAVTPSSTTSSTRATPAPAAPAAASATSPSPAPSSGNGTSTAASPTQPIQLSDLQSILATMNVPAGPGGGQQGNRASGPGRAAGARRWLSRAGAERVPGPSCLPCRRARQLLGLEPVAGLAPPTALCSSCPS